MPRSAQYLHSGCLSSWCLRIRAQRAVEYHLSHFVCRPRTPIAQPIIRRPMYQATALCRKVQCRTDGRTHPDTTHAWTARCSRLISAGKANTGNVIYKSFSASSRNSSGTDRATDPYPTASHPKRSRIMSTARSAVQRAILLLVPGRRFSSSSPSGSSSCTFQCFSRCDTEIASSDMVFSSG